MRHHGREPLNRQQARVPQGQLFLIPERCKGCGICIAFCPLKVLQLSKQTNAKGYYLPGIAAGKEHACVDCEFCSLVCPEFAIYAAEVTT